MTVFAVDEKETKHVALGSREHTDVLLGGGSLEIGSLCSFSMLKGNKKFSVRTRGRQLGVGPPTATGSAAASV